MPVVSYFIYIYTVRHFHKSFFSTSHLNSTGEVLVGRQMMKVVMTIKKTRWLLCILTCVFHFVNQESWDPELSYPPFPFRVAKSLDPDFYRNAQFDIWLDQKKGNLNCCYHKCYTQKFYLGKILVTWVPWFWILFFAVN